MWEASAQRADERYDRIDEGARRFTDEWLKKEGDLSQTRRRKRERDAAEGQALTKRGRTDGGDEREEGYGGAQGQRGSGVGVAQHKKKQSNAKLRGGRSGKPAGRNGGVAAAKDVGQKQLGTVVPVAGGMSATEESKREQGLYPRSWEDSASWRCSTLGTTV
ncbi:unnamed protein product [Pylaiella littoralis]